MKLILKNKKLTAIGGSLGFIIDKPFLDQFEIKEGKNYKLTIEDN